MYMDCIYEIKFHSKLIRVLLVVPVIHMDYYVICRKFTSAERQLILTVVCRVPFSLDKIIHQVFMTIFPDNFAWSGAQDLLCIAEYLFLACSIRGNEGIRSWRDFS